MTDWIDLETVFDFVLSLKRDTEWRGKPDQRHPSIPYRGCAVYGI